MRRAIGHRKGRLKIFLFFFFRDERGQETRQDYLPVLGQKKAKKRKVAEVKAWGARVKLGGLPAARRGLGPQEHPGAAETGPGLQRRESALESLLLGSPVSSGLAPTPRGAILILEKCFLTLKVHAHHMGVLLKRRFEISGLGLGPALLHL